MAPPRKKRCLRTIQRNARQRMANSRKNETVELHEHRKMLNRQRMASARASETSQERLQRQVSNAQRTAAARKKTRQERLQRQVSNSERTAIARASETNQEKLQRQGMEVNIELGHKAWKNIKTTKEGYTHDWTVFVQGTNGNEIKHIVDKVIFHLPDSYPDSKRMMERPPYAVSESTSQSLSIKIDVIFCAESKLRKVNYIYDIYITDEVVNASWERKLSFPNPSNEFKEKLLLAGGEQVDILKTFPVMTGEFIKIKEEPVDEIQNVNNVDVAALNTDILKIDNLQNKSGVSSEGQLHFSKLLEENRNLKKANIEIKEKIDLQEEFMVYYKENVSHYEQNILNTNLGIDELKKKIEADEREISTLKLQLQMLQVKNKLLRIENAESDVPEKRTRGIKRKNVDAMNISAAVGSEKENVIQPTKFISSCSSTTQNPPLFKNAFVSIGNQNFHETIKSNSALSIVQNAASSEPGTKINDILSGNCFSSDSNNEAHSLNDSSSNQPDLRKSQDLTLDCSRNISSVINFSFKSVNTCDVEESVKGNLDKAGASLSKLDLKNNNVKRPINQNSVKVNSSLSTPEIVIIDAKKSVKVTSAKANVFLNTPDVIIIDDEESVKGSSAKTKVSLKTPEIIVIDDEESFKESSANANTTLNEFNLRINNAEKIVEGNLIEAPTSLNKPYIESCSANNTKEKFGFPVKEHHVPSTDSSNLNREEISPKRSNFGDTIFSSLIPSNTKPPKKKKNKKSKKDRNIMKSHSLEAPTSVNKVSTEPHRVNKTQEQHVSSVESTNINSSNSNSKENGPKCSNSSDVEFSSLTPSNTNLSKRQKKKKLKKDCTQNKTTCIDSICKESHQELNDLSAPKFISFLTRHCRKLASELKRIKQSRFMKYRKTRSFSFFSKLAKIDTNQVSDECFFQYVHSLVDFFSDSETFDMPSLIYMVVDYLCLNTVSIENQDAYLFLKPSENCIVHAIFETERKSLPHLIGLVRNTLDIMHRVIITKKRVPPNGQASLCRVFMEMCKIKSDRWKPLFLCCELLRLEHPLALYLIGSLAAVWREPFTFYDNFSVEENMLLGCINYAMKEKPPEMDSELWRVTLGLRSTYFSHPFLIEPQQAIQFLTTEIVSRLESGLFENLWMLASPLVIFILNETWEWKRDFRNTYLLPKILHFSRCSNEKGFDFFCNLFVDIFSFCVESPYQQIQQFCSNTALHQGVKFVKDCAAVALLKYIGITDKRIPIPLRDWFLRNQDNPKLEILIDLYCIKVMQSRNSFLLWDDVIIV